MTTSDTVALATDDGPMPCYQARPDGAAKGGVIVVQEAFGVNSHIKDVARRFAAAGWDTVAGARGPRSVQSKNGPNGPEVTAAGQLVRATQRHMVMSSPGMSW
jgi:dienelactone hydrolase